MKGLHWDITKKCNLRCKHCYNADKYFNSNASDFSCIDELNLDEGKKVIDKIHEQGFAVIHFLGGEPLASENIFELIKYAKSYGMEVSLNSNATLLDETTQEKLIELNVDRFSASIDGATAITNDAIRGNDVFKKVCNNMKSLNKKIIQRNSTMQTSIVSVLTKANQHELHMLPKLVNELGCKLLVLSAFIESGNGKSNINTYQVEENYDTMLDEIEELVKNQLLSTGIYLQLDLRPLVAEYLKNKYNAPVIHNPMNDLCPAGEDLLYLEADGLVHPCLVYRMDSGKKAIASGELIYQETKLLENDFEKIITNNYWTTFIQKKNNFNKANIKTCKNCQYSTVCTPCPFDYDSYNLSIDACEWVYKRMQKDIKEMNNKTIKISPNVTFENNYIYIYERKVLINEVTKDFINIISAKSTSFSNIVLNISQIYNVDTERLEKELLMLVFKLKNIGIIKIEE